MLIMQGYHTNSSSAHSIMITKDLSHAEKLTWEDIVRDIEYSKDVYFGSKYFELWDVDTKGFYMLGQLYNYNDLYNFLKEKLIKKGYRYVVEQFEKLDDPWIVDHQSKIDWRIVKFSKDLIYNIVFSDYFVIRGGSDSYYDPPLYTTKVYVYLDNIEYSSKIDIKSYGYVLHTSDQIIVIPKYEILEKSKSIYFRDWILEAIKDQNVIDPPLIVDLKITDYCTYGCKFCYQGSNRNGKHADIKTIYDIIDVLSENDVVQIAIGGGDPLEHPNIIEICDYISSKGMVPNISTRNYDSALSLIEYISGGIGISISSYKEYQDFMNKFTLVSNLSGNDKYIYTSKIKLHLIPELMDQDELYDILSKDNKFDILLLGYKPPKNFNIQPKKINIKEIFNTISSNFNYVEIDTQLYRRYSEELSEVEYVKNAFSIEGVISKYVNAVDRFVSPSSYETYIKEYFYDKDSLAKALRKKMITM